MAEQLPDNEEQVFKSEDFLKKILEGHSFVLCTFNSCNFSHLNMKNTLFSKSHLKENHFTDTSLNGADFTDANLAGTVFHNCDLSKANFSTVKRYGKIFASGSCRIATRF